MKKFIYFCSVIFVIGMVSVLTSCGNDSEFYDEHVLYTTRSIDNNDNRIEIEVIAENIDNFESEEVLLMNYGKAYTSFSLKEGLMTSETDAITASSECSIELTDTLCSVKKIKLRTQGDDYHCGHAVATYLIILEKNDVEVYNQDVYFKSKNTIPTKFIPVN